MNTTQQSKWKAFWLSTLYKQRISWSRTLIEGYIADNVFLNNSIIMWVYKNQFFWPIESQTVCPTLHQLGNSRVIKLHSISVLCLLWTQELLIGPHKGYFLYELFVEVLSGWSQIVTLVPSITIIKISRMHWCFLLGKVFSFLWDTIVDWLMASDRDNHY